MHQYDIVSQIKEENKNRMFSEMGIVGFLLAIVLCIVFVGKINNPFRVVRPLTDAQLEAAFEDGVRYIDFNNLELQYTGYCRQNNEGEILYYCYSTIFDKINYIVFMSEKNLGLTDEEPASVVYSQDLKAKLVIEEDLFQQLAQDYNLTNEQFLGDYSISPIIFNAAKNDQTEMSIIWILILLLFIICIIYIVLSYHNMKDATKNPEVAALSIYGSVDEILSDINEEVSQSKEFDSFHIKVTPNWILAFYYGNVLIRRREQIEGLAVTRRVKRVYGFVKVGYEYCIRILFTEGETIKIPMESEGEAVELEDVLNGWK